MGKEETLYLSGWQFNIARLLQRIEKLVFDNGGKIVSTWEKELTTYKLIPTTTNFKFETTVYQERAITTNYRSYITFVLDGFIYSLSFDSNPFFEHYFQKIPVKDDLKVEYKYYLEKLNRDFLYDCLFSIDCSMEEIKEIANLFFNQILAFKNYQIATTRRRRYISSYGGGTNKHHYIYENIPDKVPTYRQQYYVIKEA